MRIIPIFSNVSSKLNIQNNNRMSGRFSDIQSLSDTVSFNGEFARECLAAYMGPDGKTPCAHEIKKFHIRREIDRDINNGDNLSALIGKIDLARVVRDEDKNNSEAYHLENGVRRLYKSLPERQKILARKVIARYNKSMAKHIDEDILLIKD